MRTYLRPDEIEAMIQAATNQRDRLLIKVIFHLGCRISEALGLETKDIDLKAGAVTIQHLKVRLKLACPTCGAALGRSHGFCPKCGTKVSQANNRNAE